MVYILNIQSSPQSDDLSVSRQLGNKVLEHLIANNSDTIVTKRDLTKMNINYIDDKLIQAFFTPIENRTPVQRDLVNVSDELISELTKADILIVEAPMYNWNIPSVLKSYFDLIARAKITFEYVGKGLLPQGLLKNKKAYIVTASGGIYSEGKLKEYDFPTNYVQFFLSLLGIQVVDVFHAEGQAVYGKEEALNKAIEKINLFENQNPKTNDN